MFHSSASDATAEVAPPQVTDPGLPPAECEDDEDNNPYDSDRWGTVHLIALKYGVGSFKTQPGFFLTYLRKKAVKTYLLFLLSALLDTICQQKVKLLCHQPFSHISTPSRLHLSCIKAPKGRRIRLSCHMLQLDLLYVRNQLLCLSGGVT